MYIEINNVAKGKLNNQWNNKSRKLFPNLNFDLFWSVWFKNCGITWFEVSYVFGAYIQTDYI